MPDISVQILEGVMLVCFGASWPIDIIHTLRVRRASGKSLLFMGLIILGYLTGIASKFCRGSVSSQPIEAVTWLYAFNAVLVAVDLFISGYYQRLEKQGRLDARAADWPSETKISSVVSRSDRDFRN